ncbi:MAG: hypothetical protein KGQ59_07300 [Bdellovibrionales bacterium]|nr:hypothetical protein [Bdellovibrionales bacterium]
MKFKGGGVLGALGALGALSLVILLLAYLLIQQEILTPHRAFGPLVRAEVSELQGLVALQEIPALAPWRAQSPGVGQLLIQGFLRAGPLDQTLQELRLFASQQNGRAENPDAPYLEWIRDLETYLEEEKSLERTEWVFSHKKALTLARWHVSLAQGSITAGKPNQGLVHFLSALRLSQRAFSWNENIGRDREAAFIAGKVLFFVFGRPGVLNELRTLKDTSIWSLRAVKILDREARL